MAKYHLTQKDRDFIGRKLKEISGRGRGEVPLPRRRRGVESSGGGVDIRLVKLTSDIDAATTDGEGNVTPGTGTGLLFKFGATLGAESDLTDQSVDLESYLTDAIDSGSRVFAFQRTVGIWVILEGAGDLSCELEVEEGSLVLRLKRDEEVISECSWPGYVCGEE